MFWHKRATNKPHTHRHETLRAFLLHFFLMRSMSAAYHFCTLSSERWRACLDGRCSDQPAFFSSRPTWDGSYFTPKSRSSTVPTRPRVHISPSKPCAAQPLFNSSTKRRNSSAPNLPWLPPTGRLLYQSGLAASYRANQRDKVDLGIPKLAMILWRLVPELYNSTARSRIPSYETELNLFFMPKMKQRYVKCSFKNARGYNRSVDSSALR